MARLILHIGQAKTGSTSIQHFLSQNASVLKAGGVIYPRGRHGFVHNHHTLLPLVFTGQHLAPHIRERMGPDMARAQRLAQSYKEKLLTEIARHRDCDFVLSGESYLRPFLDDEADRMRNLVHSFGMPVDVHVYLREPSSHYVSLLQQRLKSSSGLRPLRPVSVTAGLRTYRDISENRLRIRLFDRKLLHNGDVVQDFLAWTGLNRIEGLKAAPALNESMSAEAMDVLTTLGASDRDGTRIGRSRQRRIRIKVRRLDAQIPGATKPRLLPDAQARLIRQGSDLLRLRDEFGIVFPDLDYACIPANPQEDPVLPTRIDQIIAFDRERRDVLLAHLRETRTGLLDFARSVFR
jgi:hypothetical protein